MAGEYVFVPVEALAGDDVTTGTYRVLRNCYWAYKPGEGVAFYRLTPRSRYVSPQCNSNLTITEKIIRNVGPAGTRPLLVEVAFLPMDSTGTLLPTLPDQTDDRESLTSAENPTGSDVVGRIMDKAQSADREALFAALQAAVGRIINTWMDRDSADVRADLTEVEHRLDYGRPYGR